MSKYGANVAQGRFCLAVLMPCDREAQAQPADAAATAMMIMMDLRHQRVARKLPMRDGQFNRPDQQEMMDDMRGPSAGSVRRRTRQHNPSGSLVRDDQLSRVSRRARKAALN
jgi:hypothetical protein